MGAARVAPMTVSGGVATLSTRRRQGRASSTATARRATGHSAKPGFATSAGRWMTEAPASASRATAVSTYAPEHHDAVVDKVHCRERARARRSAVRSRIFRRCGCRPAESSPPLPIPGVVSRCAAGPRAASARQRVATPNQPVRGSCRSKRRVVFGAADDGRGRSDAHSASRTLWLPQLARHAAGASVHSSTRPRRQ